MNLWTISLRRLLADLGVGGTSWTGTRASGDGITAAPTLANLSAITLYVFEELPSALQMALAGVQLAPGAWWGLAAAGSNILIGDTRTSVADASYSFRVASVDTMAGLMLCRLERL